MAWSRKLARDFRESLRGIVVLAAYAGVAALAWGGWTWFADRGPTTAVIPVDGVIGQGRATADRLTLAVQDACALPHLRRIVFAINSSGGDASTAERVRDAVARCRSTWQAAGAPLQVEAVIQSSGASAAYMIALLADDIVADRYAEVGSIGFIWNMIDVKDAAAAHGIHETTVRSSPIKGGPSIMSPPTPAMLEEQQALVDSAARQFGAEVLTRRGARLRVSLPELLQGHVYSAADALALGLIDRIGTRESEAGTLWHGTRVVDVSVSGEANWVDQRIVKIARLYLTHEQDQIDAARDAAHRDTQQRIRNTGCATCGTVKPQPAAARPFNGEEST